MVLICIRIHPSGPDRRPIIWSRAGVEPGVKPVCRSLTLCSKPSSFVSGFARVFFVCVVKCLLFSLPSTHWQLSGCRRL